jgi:N12 class adenine-specific DNA methylase/PAS domain-containing protein
MAQVNDNDDIKWLYGKLKAKGYNIGSEAEFKSSLANGEDRKWYYEKAKDMGLDMGSMADFESMYAPKAAPAPKREAPSSGQRKPASAVSASPEQPKQQKPKGTPMTEQDKIRMSLQMGQMKQQVQQGIANTNAKIGRMMEPLTQKGRERRRLGEFQARMAGTPTHVVGFNTASPAPASSGARGGSRQKPVQSEQSPQPYGVKYENGKAKTQWVLPDGTLTTSLIEANQAEYEARTARLAHQFQNRMKENGLDPNKPEDVRKQAQLDYEAPMRKAIEDEWQRAEAEDRAADEAYRKDMERAEGGSFWDRLKKSITPLGPDGMPLRRGDETLRDIKRAAKRQDTFNLEKMAQSVLQNMPQEYKDNQMLNYSRYFREHPSELKGRTVSQAAKEALQGEVYHATYERAVQARMPKSKTEFLLRKVADQPFFSQTIADNMAARLFSHSIGTEAADMDAMSRYGTDHRALDITGTVLNMAIDPTTYISGGVGSFAGKQALKLSGKMALKGASKEAAERYVGRTLAGRMVAGVAAGSANFGTFEGLKNMQQQMRLGGTLNPETGEYEFSAGDMLKATGHGMLLGSVTGTLSPVLGNVSDKLVKATESTAGKVGIRAGELMTSTVAEGTIFATPEWIENAQLADDDPRKRKAMDIWTDNMAMMLGFKVSHGIKSAPQVIAGLRPIAEPKTMEERNRNRRSFAERLRKRMDASPRDLDFTKEEREELRRNGYGDLASLFTRTPKQPTKPKAKPTRPKAKPTMTDGKTMTFDVDYQHAEAKRVSNPEFDGYEAMERLMQDPNVSQSARAKAYYILTGRMLPMGTVTGYTTNKDANGVTVQAMTAQGEVVTSRHFKTEEEAKKEEANIMRQAELNSVDVGERYKEAAANAKVVQAAVESVAPGADFATVMRNYKAVKEGDKDAIAAYGKMVEDIDRAIEANKTMADGERPEAIRASIKEETGVDVDATLRKEPKNRTEEEQAAVEDYIKRLFPEQKSEEAGASAEAEQPMSEAESAAAAAYDQARLLWDKVEKGDTDAKAEVDAITLRMQEAYQMCEDAFGADAEMRIAEINEDPWPLVNNPELSEDQQDAVLYYVNAKAAMEGVMDASNEAADGKRKEVEANVERHTHKDMGVVQPATMKVDDKPVYVVKGNVVMLPDGSGIDVRNSDQSIVICDAETGEYKFASPDQLFSLGEAIDPQTELDEAYANIQAEHEAILGGTENGGNVPNSAENVPQLTDEQLQQYAHSAFNEATQSNGITIPQEQAEQLQQHNQQMLEQEQQRKEEEANRQPTVLERVPINEETGEPMFEKADRETALDALNEVTGGNDENTTAIVRAQVEQATKALEALKKKEPTKKAPSLKGSPMTMVKAQQEAEANYNTAMEEYNAQVAAAEENLNAWSRINSLMNDRKRAIREQQEAERKVREEKLHAEAVARLEEDKRIAAEKAAEQEAVGTHAVNPKIKAKWDGATKVEGNPNAITLADGSTIRGHYVLTEAGAATASHDVNNAYEPTEGFPVDENGESVNDRDYKRDKDAQRIVRDMADSYDSRALQTPVIVSKDGVVLSGNNRTMSGEIAAKNGTDKAYVDHLREFGAMFGFTPEQIDGMQHPRVVFVPDEELPYDASTFARFNAEQQKKQSKPEHAVKLGKIVPDNVFTSITNDISRFDRMSDYYADDKSVASAISQLLDAGVINEMQLPELRTGNALSAAGKELIENTLIGKVFQTSPDAVRQIISTPTLRQSVVMGLNEIANNRTLAKSGYDLSKELAAAVDLVSRAKSDSPEIYKEGMPVSPYGRQQGLFDDEYGDSRVTDGVTLLLADLLNSGKPSDLRKVLSTYNNEAASPAAGQIDMFSGDVTSKEEILKNVNEYFRNATPKEQQALIDAAVAERKRRAEAAEPAGGDEASEQATVVAGSDAEPQQPVVASEKPVKGNEPDADALAKEAEDKLSERITDTEDEWTEPSEYGEIYKHRMFVDGKEVIKVDAPDKSKNYPGTYYEIDGKQFGDLYEVANYIDGNEQPLSAKIEAASAEVNTDPTEAQKEAGNYKKGHVQVGTFDITIEQPQGSVRKGTDADGKQWESKMNNTYGYIRGAVGVDGDHIDVFLSNDIDGWNGRKVYVVDQYNPDGSFDEHKVMLGFNDADEAKGDYLANYEQGWENGRRIDITGVNLEDFEKWIESSKRKTKPFGEYSSVKKDVVEINTPEEAGYSITPSTYTNKKGKTSDVSLLTFGHDLTADQERAVKEFAKERTGEGRFAPARGWKDRESGGWMFRSEEDARKAAEMVGNEQAVADNQPMTAQELRDAVEPKKPTASKKTAAKKPANRVESVPTEEPIEPEKPKYEVSDEEMNGLMNDIRDILGIGDDEGDARFKFRDPDELTAEQRQKLMSVGQRLAMAMVERGNESFGNYASMMVKALGDKVRPWLKAFYGGLEYVPGYDKYALTPYEEVKAFDVENFDKPTKDVMAQANMIVEEGKAQVAAEKANNELKATRNEQRKETEKQTAANTDAVAAEAKSVASEATALAETSSDEQALTGAAERVDETLDKVNEQLALLGYYEADEVEKDYNEAYGYMRNAEKKAVKDAANLASQLISDLNLSHYEASHSKQADKKGNRKKKPLAVSNISHIGGDVSIHLPLEEGRELYLTIGVEPRAAKGVDGFGGSDLEVTHIMFRVDHPEGTGNDRYGRNVFVDSNVTYSDLLKQVQREAYKYLIGSGVTNEGEYAAGDKVQYSTDGGRTWTDAVVVQPNDEGGIRIDTGLAPVMWVNAHPDQLRHKPSESAEPKHEAVGDFYEDGINEDAVAALPEDTAIQLHVVDILNPGMTDHSMKSKIESLNTLLPKISDKKLSELDKEYGDDKDMGTHIKAEVARRENEGIFKKAERIAKEAKTEREKTPIDNNGFGIYQKAYDDFIDGIEHKGMLPNVKALKNMVTKAKRRLGVLEKGAAVGIKNDEDLKRHEKAVHELINMRDAYQAMLDYVNKRMKTSEVKTSKVKPEQPVGDLFAGLFDEPNNNETADSNSSSPSQTVAGAERPDTVGIDETGTDGAERTTAVAGTDGERSTDASRENGREAADGAVHGTDEVGGIQPPVGNRGRDESTADGTVSNGATNERGRVAGPRTVQTGEIDGGGKELSSGEPASSTGEGSRPSAVKKQRTPVRKFTNNFHYGTDGNEADNYTPAQRLEGNVSAIEVIAKLFKEGRKATDEEKQILSRFRGWGQIDQLSKFYSVDQMRRDTYGNSPYRRLANAIDTLDPDGKKGVFAGIKRAALSSYYTPTKIASAMNSFLSLAGFKGGTFLDPSMGNGIFEGTLPKDIQERTMITGVELDWLSGQISRALYPDADVRICGFEKSELTPNSQDVVTSNVPFGGIEVNDPTWKNDNSPVKRSAQKRIHNYYAVKMLELTRPGGIVAMMTSPAVMDTQSNQHIRRYIAEQGEFLGAVRLPDNTFQGTGAMADIIYIRKWKDEEDAQKTRENPDYAAREQAFLSSAETTAPNKRNGEKQKVSHNAYYASNRKNMIGDVVAGNQYNDKSFGLHSELTTDQIAKEVEKTVKRIVGDRKGMLFDTTRTSREVKQAVREEYKGDGNWVSTGNLVIQDGKVGVLTATKNEYGEVTRVFEEQPQLAKQKKRIIAMGEVRTAMKELIAGQIDGLSDTKLNMLRAKLKRAYEEFVSKYGKLQDTDNTVVLSDIDGYTLQALEVWKGGKFQGLSDIFTKNTIKPALKLEDAKTPQEAITTSLAEYGEIRGEYIEKTLGADWFGQCGDLVFKEPNATDRYVTRDEYLSGDVVAKLEEAKTAAATDPTFERNVKELEQVQPATIPFDDITIHLGARWIPQEVLNDFVKETLGLHASSSRSYEWVDGERREIIKSGVVYVPETDTFEINIEAKELGGQADDWKTADKSVKEIFQAALEDKDFRIVRKDKDGNTWIDQEATELANSKVADLREHFEQWLPGDDARVQTMERAYNDRFNRIVLRKWDGSHLNVPGLMGKELRPHQKDAVWMLINNRGGIVDHIVGAGKTLVMQSAIMEMRRMGIAKKPMIVALKSTVPQIAREFKEAYPTARVLAPSEKDFSTENRKKFFANISLNDYDCIIVSHEQYCKIPHSEEAEGDVVNEQLAQLDAMIEYLYGTGDKSQLTKRQIKSLEKRRQNLHAKLEKRLDRSTDREFCFENMGIDYLFVDECHQFKSLPYVTSYQNVAGLGEASGSNKAVALLTGIRHLQKMHQGDKGTVFLSGTTITNSLVEIYNLLNYLRPRKLEQLGMPTFDAWASTFAVHSSELEAGVSNEFKMKDRFRYFDNVPELSQLYAEIADVRNDYNLQLPKPKVDGKTVIVPQSDAVAEINREVVNMLQTKDGSYFGIHPKDPKKFPWGLVASGISAKAAVSPRLVFPEMDDSVGKISYCCDNIKKSYDEMKEQKGVQLVFCELGVPTKGKEYDAYHDIINRLTKDYGIPREEIAYIQQVKNDTEKEALFQKVRDGKVRILIGGTRNMGTGVNVQTRITDLHMLTVPWQPADLEQCIGRGSRQGNVVAHDFLDNKVRVHYYATEGSLDLYKYQLLDAKGKMFTQFKMGTISGERSFDEGDADENGNIDPAQMVALLSGNPIIFEKSKQDKLVKKLKSLYNGFLRDQQRKRQNYETVTKKVDNLKRLISLSDSDVHDLQREGFKPDEKGTYPSKVKVCVEGSYYGQDFDKPKEAGQYILEQLKNNKKVVLAGFGQRADVVFVTGDDLLSSHYEVQLGGNNAWSIRYTKRMPQDPTQAGLVFRSLLEQIIHNNEVYHREYDTNSEMLKTMPKGDAPFPKQKELDEAIAKQKELDAEYNKLGQSEEDKTKFRLLDADDPKAMELESLPESEFVPVYRNVQAFEDDALGSPMAFTDAETGERRTLEGRRWNYSAPPKVELTEEQQRKLDELNKSGYIMVDGKKSTELQINDGLKFVKPKTKEAQLQYFLKKNPEDKGLWAAYDPYDHAIETPLNTQFGEAYKRPNLVVVRSLIPKSEIDEPFHADYALLPTGAHQWNNGRVLYLSRWSKIDKVLTREEEAKLIDEYWKKHPGKREELKTHRDYNRFVPQVRRELEKMGYRFELDGKELTPEESLALDKQNWESRDIIPGREGHTPFVSNEDIARINAKMAGKWVGEPKEAMESAMSERVTELSERLHTPVRIIRTEEEVAALPSVRQRRMKGSFNPITGEVTIVVPNNANMADIENTFVHEVVGHDGLRVLFPDEAKLNNALDELYRVSKDEIRGTIDRMAQKMYDAEVDRIREKKRKEHVANGEDANASYYADMAAAHAEAGKKREQFKRDATEEYGADLAGRIGEKGFEKMSAEELTFWGKLKAMLQKALQKLLDGLKIPGKRKWGDKDWAYVLHEAYKRKKNGGKPTVFDAADTEVMRRKTGFGEMKFSDGKHEQKSQVATTIADMKQRVIELFEKAKTGEFVGKPASIGRLSVDGKAYLEKLSDLKFKEFVDFVLNPSDLNHIRSDHYGENEKDKGNNVPLTDEDIQNMVDVLNQPDGILYGVDKKDGRKLFFFLKDAGNGLYNLTEVCSTKKGNLTAKSFFKSKKKGISQRVMEIKDSLLPTSVTYSGEFLSSDAKIPTLFEINEGSSKNVADEGIMFRDGDMGLEETITKMKVVASQANADNWQAKQDAMRAIGGNLNKLRQAMARQREYDLSTVKSITDLAKVLLENGLLDDLSKYETKRILSAVNNVHGKQDVSDYVQKVMDIMVDNQLRMGANQLGKLLSIRGSRIDARGIEVQGQLDPEGQRIAQVVRKATSLPKENIEERIADCTNRMSSDDNAVAEEAAIEYSGLLLAHQFVEDITESKAEEKALRESIKEAKADLDAGTMEADAYREYVESTNDAIRQNKIERAEAYRSIVEQVGGVLGGSVERAKAWREAEKQRVETIHHNANSDMTGRPNDEHHKESKAQKIANNSIVRFVLAPLGTFDQMLRMFGKKSVNGEGYLWNRYMRGWVEATEKEYTGYQNALKTLDEKVSEVFDKKMKWGDLFSLERNLPKATVTFWDGGEQKAHELTQGNLLYIYMVDKMADGRMKLRRMGITEEDVENIKEFVDPRFLELADWMQDEFLVEKRNEYNEVHKRMFGASMAAIENYFPLKILANARIEEVDVADDTTDTALPATSIGSIIKRRRNNLALDVMGADAFSVILDHIQQMERWASFAEFNRDLNTLLSYKRFRNQVMNMTSVYGGGKTLWKNFRNVCSMAAGAYRPPIAVLDKAAVNVAKGVTAAKVSFRVFTALKQFLSMPAYLSDSSPVYLAGNIANPIGAWKWSMENLPLFEKRWKSRMAGDPRLMKSEMDWKMWQNRAVEIASRIGMSPNAFVDALTVAIGAHSMYQTKKRKYLRYGYDEETAEKRAKQDATILFNQTQQSSESAFLSTMQTDRSWLSVLFTVFRNSSMSYTRQLYDALRNLKHRFEPGYKGLTEEYLAKQMRRDGIDPDKADQNAKSEYRRSLMRDIVRVGVFGYLLQLAWNLGAYLPYLLLGDDKDEKSDMWHDIFCHTMFGSIEGLTGGDVMSAIGNGFAKGEGLNLFSASKDMPLSSDLQNIVSKWNKDKVAAMNDVTNLMVQSGIGVNPQSLTDAVVAIMDYCGDDANTSRECALLITRIINCPQSQIDKIYFDELNATAAEAQGMTPAEIAERYARYKMHRGAPLTGWAYTDEARDSVMTAQQNRVLTKAKEKLNSRMETEETKQLLSDYDAVAKQETALSKIKKTDRAAYREGMKQLRQSNDMRQHMRLKRYKHDMKELTSKYLRCKSAEERDSIVSTMFSTRAKMLEDIGRLKQQ